MYRIRMLCLCLQIIAALSSIFCNRTLNIKNLFNILSTRALKKSNTNNTIQAIERQYTIGFMAFRLAAVKISLIELCAGAGAFSLSIYVYINIIIHIHSHKLEVCIIKRREKKTQNLMFGIYHKRRFLCIGNICVFFFHYNNNVLILKKYLFKAVSFIIYWFWCI